MTIMLDFVKAYDSLKRAFLEVVLRGFGVNTPFVHFVMALHRNRSTVFQGNGERSEPVAVSQGIRQGCPLAPLHFLLAVETLGHAFKQMNDIQGLCFQIAQTGVTQVFAGFVDDSTLFLRRERDLNRCIQVLELFRQTSGIVVQPKKCMGIWLNTAQTATSAGGFPILRHGDTERYLEVLVGTGPQENVTGTTVCLCSGLGSVLQAR